MRININDVPEDFETRQRENHVSVDIPNLEESASRSQDLVNKLDNVIETLKAQNNMLSNIGSSISNVNNAVSNITPSTIKANVTNDKENANVFSEKTDKSFNKFVNQATSPGSIYTHDTHLTGLLDKIKGSVQSYLPKMAVSEKGKQQEIYSKLNSLFARVESTSSYIEKTSEKLDSETYEQYSQQISDTMSNIQDMMDKFNKGERVETDEAEKIVSSLEEVSNKMKEIPEEVKKEETGFDPEFIVNELKSFTEKNLEPGVKREGIEEVINVLKSQNALTEESFDSLNNKLTETKNEELENFSDEINKVVDKNQNVNMSLDDIFEKLEATTSNAEQIQQTLNSDTYLGKLGEAFGKYAPDISTSAKEGISTGMQMGLGAVGGPFGMIADELFGISDKIGDMSSELMSKGFEKLKGGFGKLFGKGAGGEEKQEEQQTNILDKVKSFLQQLVEPATTKGSLYTHDIKLAEKFGEASEQFDTEQLESGIESTKYTLAQKLDLIAGKLSNIGTYAQEGKKESEQTQKTFDGFSDTLTRIDTNFINSTQTLQRGMEDLKSDVDRELSKTRYKTAALEDEYEGTSHSILDRVQYGFSRMRSSVGEKIGAISGRGGEGKGAIGGLKDKLGELGGEGGLLGMLTGGLFTGVAETLGPKILSKLSGLTPAIVGGIASIFTGAIWAVIDGIRGAMEFGGISGFVGSLLGGMDKGLMGAFKNMGKWALIGAGIGTVVPGIGILIGGVVGAAFGAIMGWIGGEKLSKIFSPLNKLIEPVKGLFTQIKDVFAGIISAIKPIVSALMPIASGVLKAAFYTLAFTLKALIKTITWALKPIEWITKAIGWTLDKAIGIVKTLLSGVVETVTAPFKWLWSAAKGANGMIQSAASGAFSVMTKPFEWLYSFGQYMWGKIKKSVKMAWDIYTKPFEWLYAFAKYVWGNFKETVQMTWDVVKGPFNWLYTQGKTFYERFKGIIDPIWNIITWPFEKIKTGFTWLSDKISSIINAVKSYISDKLSWIPGVEGSSEKTAKGLQKEGVVDLNTWGASEIKDWGKIKQLPIGKVKTLLNYDDWSDKTRKRLKSIIEEKKQGKMEAGSPFETEFKGGAAKGKPFEEKTKEGVGKTAPFETEFKGGADKTGITGGIGRYRQPETKGESPEDREVKRITDEVNRATEDIAIKRIAKGDKELQAKAKEISRKTEEIAEKKEGYRELETKEVLRRIRTSGAEELAKKYPEEYAKRIAKVSIGGRDMPELGAKRAATDIQKSVIASDKSIKEYDTGKMATAKYPEETVMSQMPSYTQTSTNLEEYRQKVTQDTLRENSEKIEQVIREKQTTTETHQKGGFDSREERPSPILKDDMGLILVNSGLL